MRLLGRLGLQLHGTLISGAVIAFGRRALYSAPLQKCLKLYVDARLRGEVVRGRRKKKGCSRGICEAR